MSEEVFGQWSKVAEYTVPRTDIATETFRSLLESLRTKGKDMTNFTYEIFITNEEGIETLGIKANPKPKLRERDQ